MTKPLDNHENRLKNERDRQKVIAALRKKKMGQYHRSGALEPGQVQKPYFSNKIITSPKIACHPEEEKEAVERIKKAGIKTGMALSLQDIPYICYTSRVDPEVHLEEFEGAIQLGHHVVLHSGAEYPFPNGPVRLTVVKSRPDKRGEIRIGNDVFLPGTSIVSYEQVTIGDNVIIGSMVVIMDSSGHTLEGRGKWDEMQRISTAPVEIKKGAWIGYGAIILKGVVIGENSVVGANSVVHASVPDNTVVAGNPAKIIKRLK